MSDQLSRRQFIKAAKGFIAGAASVGSVSLTSHLVSSVAMVRPAYAVTPVGLVLLRCYGSETEARYLDGLTATGEVQLSFNVGENIRVRSGKSTTWTQMRDGNLDLNVKVIFQEIDG